MAVTKSFLVSFSLYLLAASAGAQPEATDPFEISDGGKTEITEKGFTIRAPKGWELHHKAPGLRLLLLAPAEPNMSYRRNIQVLSLGGPYYIDSESQKEFATTLLENFGKLDKVEKFSLRDSKILELKETSKGILYYTDYEMNGQRLMQAHILVSSEKHHFLVTFTDLREHFENKEFESLIREAWDSLMSIHLDSPAPERLDLVTWLVAAGALLLISTIITLLIRKRRKNPYALHEFDEDPAISDSHDEDEDKDPY